MKSARSKTLPGEFSRIGFFAVVLGLTPIVAHGAAVETESLFTPQPQPQAQATPTTSDARSRRVSETSGADAPKTNSPTGSSANPQATEQSPAASQVQSPTDVQPRRSRNRRRPPIENTISVPEASPSPALPKSVWSPPSYQTVIATPAQPSSTSRMGSLLRAVGRSVQSRWLWSLPVLALAALGFIGIRWRSRRQAADTAEQGYEKTGPINEVLEETPERIHSQPIIAEAFADVASEPEVEADESASPVAGGSSPTVREGSGSDTGALVYSRATAAQVVEPLGDARESKLQADEEFRLEQHALLKTQEELQRLRLEIAIARRKADEETRALAEATTQIHADEEARHELEEELQRLKLEATNRLQEERLRYEETRRHVIEEQQRVQTELGRLFAEEDERLKALELQKQQAEEELQQRVEQERRIKGEIDELFKAGAEQRARIELETRRRAEAELRLTEEKALLCEAEKARDQIERPANIVQTTGGVLGPDGVTVETDGIQPASDSTISSELAARLNSVLSEERVNALRELAALGGEDSFRLISRAFDDPSVEVRSAAARALYEFHIDRAVSYTRALREGSPERRRSIGASVASSGLARDAIANLTAESREQSYDAFSILFLMARAGELQPLLSAVEDYPDLDVRLAVVKLLGLTGQPEIIPAFQSFSEHPTFPAELKSAITDVICQLGSKSEHTTPSVA